MLELLQSGGWLMVPIGLCSVATIGIGLERLWALRVGRAAPQSLLADVEGELQQGEADSQRLSELCRGCHLGTIFLAGLARARHGREAMKEAMEDVAATVVHDMERYLTALGTIAAISPLLGLLGTVIGMIEVFRVLVEDGIGNPGVFASGISEALVTTAAGLAVAIPALILHRYLLRKVDDLVVVMERQSTRLVDLMHGDRGQS
ncbi:MAG: MotA/TolQ/ExbB proton channel family protein [Gammaproteobacteria bacterium]|nr:MotA/TolQ/ExbB proton channel family protein [Gammaproteobacteria bacterium]